MNFHEKKKWSRPTYNFEQFLQRSDFKTLEEFEAYYDQKLAQSIAAAKVMHRSAACPILTDVLQADGTTIKKSKHHQAEVAFVCKHVMQDSGSSDTIVMFSSFWLCGTCHRLFDQGKFSRDRDLVTWCGGCVSDTVARLMAISPEKVIVRAKKHSGSGW